MDPRIDSLFAQMLFRMDSEDGFDPEAFLQDNAAEAEELRRRLLRLQQVGVAPHARNTQVRLREVRERFSITVEPPARAPGQPGAEGTLGELLPSQVVGGRYRILSEIGRGGMGRVFRALDTDLSREVALKIANLEARWPGVSAEQSRDWVQRFVVEAQVTSQLEHPSIVPVHDIGFDRSGQLYYTMKLVEGVTLDQKIEQWHRAREAGLDLPIPELLRIVIQVCQAIAYAHERGVLHRDLKPSNVMIGRFGEVQVMDWGLAKRLGEPGTGSARPGIPDRRREGSTLAGEVLGTPTHMAPEQARGDVDAVDRATDIYGLGAILHHGLKGVPPNQADGHRRHVATKLSAELEAVCERALQADPMARYSSATELAEDLQAILDLRVVRAFKTGAWAELRMWIRRNRATATAALVAGLAVTLALFLQLVMNEELAEKRAEIALRTVAFDVQTLEEEAAELWPVSVEDIDTYVNWIRRARELCKELPLHRANLRSLQGAEDRASLWQTKLLANLIARLETLESGLLVEDYSVPGKGFSVPLRLRQALSVRTEFSEDGAALRAWKLALPAIRSAYPGLEIEPQVGLVPLGPDPESGLWEFADLVSGLAPQRDIDGRLACEDSSAIVYVLVPAGEFRRGAQSTDPDGAGYDPDAEVSETPPQRVGVSAFLLSKFELTQGQWWRLQGENPSQYGPSFWVTASTGSYPVDTITWWEASEAVRRIGAVLPSEAQWQYACRARQEGRWWSGDDPADLARVANLKDQALQEKGWPSAEFERWSDGHASPAPVGSYPANPFGLHDMHGNVSEWCRDDFASYLDSTQDPVSLVPSARTKMHMGGAFSSMATQARITHRPSSLADARNGGIGLRPARALLDAPALPFPKPARPLDEAGDSLPGVTAPLVFFQGRGTDPEPEALWRDAARDSLVEDFSRFSSGDSIAGIELQGVSIDFLLRHEEHVEETAQVLGGAFGSPSAMEGNALLLRSDQDCPPMSELELSFDPPVRGVGFWLFDDYGPDIRVWIEVVPVEGEPEYRFMNPASFAGVEGYFGCISPSKVARLKIRAQFPRSEDVLWLDGLTVAP